MPLFSFSRKPELSSTDQVVLEQYLGHFRTKIDPGSPLEAIGFVVLDTEASGLDLSTAQMLSLAALGIEGFKIKVEDRLERFCQQKTYRPGDDVAVHGIMHRHIDAARTEKEVISEFMQWVGNRVIVGHHIGFDIGLLNTLSQRYFGMRLKNRTLDTATLYKRLENPHPGHSGAQPGPVSLDFLCNLFGIPLGDRHTAAEDTFITALVFLKLLSRIRDRKVNTFKHFFGLRAGKFFLALSAHFTLFYTF